MTRAAQESRPTSNSEPKLPNEPKSNRTSYRYCSTIEEINLSAPNPPVAAGDSQPGVIRQLTTAEETAHERLVRKHVPAWVISGAMHVVFIALMILIFGARSTDAKIPDTILITSVDKTDEEKIDDLTKEDLGLTTDIEPGLPELKQQAEKNVDRAERDETIGVPKTRDNDPSAYPLPGLPPADPSTSGAPGDQGNTISGSGGESGLMMPAFRGRGAAAKQALLDRYGGTRDGELAVGRGLAWLARQQKGDGSWVFDGAKKEEIIAATGMALLPFLAAGQTHKSGKYQRTVASGLNYLLKNLPVSGPNAGKFSSNSTTYMYAHGIATIALCEAYGMTKDKALLLAPAQAAINYIQRGQAPDGSWGYLVPMSGDTSIVGWQVQALKAVQLSKDIVVDDKIIKKSIDFLNKVSAGSRKAAYGYKSPADARPGTALTAVGLLCRYYIDGWGPNNGGMSEGVEGLMKRNPQKGAQFDMYFYYYATQVVHFFEGPEWKIWNEGPVVNGVPQGGMRDWLIGLQLKKDGPNLGSWEPDAGFIGKDCGRLGTTCMAILTLEVYYRQLPLYKRDNGGLKVLDRVK